MKRILPLILAFILCVSCLSGAADASGHGLPSEPRLSAAARALSAPNAPQDGSADGSVRVIVRLEGEPAAEAASGTRFEAERRLALQHTAFENRIAAAGVACRLDYEYSCLFNGMALTVAREDLDKLAALSGVRGVYVANRYAPPFAAGGSSGHELTGTVRSRESGAKGSGTVIAVLDSGITPEHEAFGVYDGMLTAAKLSASDAQTQIESLGRGVCLSQKIPFAWDYADLDGDVADDAAGGAAGHGTHAAGIAAGYAPSDDGSLRFCGAAPDAQLLAMKIYSSYGDGGTDSAVYFRALEDAYLLGADVIDLALGAPSGFAYDEALEDELCGDIFQTLRDNGVLVTAAAGDEDSMAGHASNRAGAGYVTADYADCGVLASPASYGRNIAVASAENETIAVRVLEAGEREIRFRDDEGSFFETFRSAGTKEYVVIPDFGRQEDYAGLSVRGRIALVSRGQISCQEKLACAAKAGAVGLLVYNNEAGEFQPDVSDYSIPAAAISREDGEYLLSLAKSAAPDPIPEPDPDDTEEDLASAFYPISSQEQLIEGSYLIVCESAALAFDPSSAERVNQPGNWFKVPGFQSGIRDEGQAARAALYYDRHTLSNSLGAVNCNGTEDQVLMENDSAEDLQITIRPEGTAEIRCRGCSFRYNEAEEVFRFYRPSSPLFDDPKAAVKLYRRSAVLYDPSRVGELSFPDRFVYEENGHGGELSAFSSMGVTPELGLKPTLTGTGGSVCSAAGGTADGYAVRSGSSLAASEVSGTLACLLQYLTELRPELGVRERAELAESLLESTAQVLSDDEGRIVTPRRQGAGLIDLSAASEARACITEPIQSLGDSPEGCFTLRFRVRNLSEQAESFSVTPFLLRDSLSELDLDGDGTADGLYNTLRSETVTDAVEVLGPGTVVVPAEEETEVTLTLRLKEELLQTMRSQLPNGGFLDGFIGLREMTQPCDGGEDCPGRQFTDMPRPGSWAHPGIDFALRNHFFQGTSETTFSPKGTMDRAMTVTVLYALAGRPAPAGASPFPDVPQGKYYTKAVTWAAENDIVAGNSDGNFNPKGNVTREQLAAILLRFAEYLDLDTETSASIDDYPDVDRVHGWARKAVSWAIGTGVLSGVASEGKVFLKPRANATRDQVAAIFMSFVNKCMNPPDPMGELHVSFTGFVGDWTDAPILEQHDWREIVDLEQELIRNDPEGGGDSLAQMGSGYLELAGFEVNTDVNKAWLVNGAELEDGVVNGYYLGGNPYGFVPYDEARSCLSPGGSRNTVYMQPMLLRNARRLIMAATDAETGELYAADAAKYLPKAAWDPVFGRWSAARGFRYDGTDLEGKPLPDGTRVELRFYADLAWGADELGAIAYEDLAEAGEDWLVWQFSLTVDDTAPTFDELRYDAKAKTLSFTITEEGYLACAALQSRFPTPDLSGAPSATDPTPLWQALWADDAPGQTRSVTVENVEPGEYILSASDYAGNETRVVLALKGGSRLFELHFLCPEGCGTEDYDVWLASYQAQITLPDLSGTPLEGEFSGWIAEPLDGIWSWEDLEEAALNEEVHLQGEGLELWGETWLYALLRTPAEYSDPEELITQSLEDAGDYSGVLAFGGYDRDLESGLCLMDSSGEAWDSAAEDVLICREPDPDTLFELTACEGGYTVRSEAGNYMAAVGDTLFFVDQEELDENCVWKICFDDQKRMTRVYNDASPERYTLIYDVLNERFCLTPAALADGEFHWLAVYRPAILEWGYFTAE